MLSLAVVLLHMLNPMLLNAGVLSNQAVRKRSSGNFRILSESLLVGGC